LGTIQQFRVFLYLSIPQDVFLNKLLVSVKKQQKIELTKEQGWYSEGELVELGWNKSGSYFAQSMISPLVHPLRFLYMELDYIDCRP
jgi:hypothetical protein